MPVERIRKYLRVSLRTLMLLVLLFAVLLGFQVNKARQQRRVVAAVEKYGGWVHYDHEFVAGKLDARSGAVGALLAPSGAR